MNIPLFEIFQIFHPGSACITMPTEVVQERSIKNTEDDYIALSMSEPSNAY